ncbi:hypothetical protein Cantr_06668 [Candida viswanathii]|uniref:Uncharacterized protein n=1 Tax=Candida viswanathii TaxID=5486 RepID=A0A367XWK5_9ASCO|nr:hypothetical protein Cantr_06668 [Candida viswanathii]
MTASLLGYPPEIISLILDYFDKEELEDIKDVPEIQCYVYQKLYSTVILGRSDDDINFESPAQRLCSPISLPIYGELQNVADLIKIIESHPTVRPNRILFKHLVYLFQLHERKPDILQGVNIGISLEMHQGRGRWDPWMLQRLIELPYRYDTVRDVSLEPEKGMTWDLLLKLTRNSTHVELSVNFDELVDLLEGDSELEQLKQLGLGGSLTQLSLTNQIDIGDLKYVPDSVLELTCELVGSISGSKVRLACPENLVHFGVRFDAPHPLSHFDIEVDIAHLKNLKSIEVNSVADMRWLLPKDMRSILMDGFVDMRRLHVDHPNLTYFSNLTSAHYLRIHDEGAPIRYPLGLMKLDVPLEYYLEPMEGYAREPRAKRRKVDGETSDSEEDEHERMRLPESLMYLRHTGSDDSLFENLIGSVLDFNKYALPCLSCLYLEDIHTLKIPGNYLPPSLTDLQLIEVKNVDVCMLENLNNLTKLFIERCSLECSQPNVKLPKSIRYLQVLDSDPVFALSSLEVLGIRHLQLNDNGVLHVSGNFEQDSPRADPIHRSSNRTTAAPPPLLSRVVAPGSLAWMETIVRLDLEGTPLEGLPILPPNVKHVTMARCGIERFVPVNNRYMFPDTLEFLDLGFNDLTVGWFTSVRGENLKHLDLQGNEITRLGRQGFSGFTMLESLNLGDNNLSGIEEELLHADVFGPLIRYLKVTNCKLTKSAAKKIIELVTSKPGFERLIIDYDLIGVEYSELVANTTVVVLEDLL